MWIDHVIRLPETFSVTPEGKFGRLRDRPVFIAVASGGVYSGELADQSDFLTPYLKAVFGAIGLHDLTFFSVQGAFRGREFVDASRAEADKALRAYFSSYRVPNKPFPQIHSNGGSVSPDEPNCHLRRTSELRSVARTRTRKAISMGKAVPASIMDAANLMRLINSAYRGHTDTAGWTDEADLLVGPRINRESLITLLTEGRGTMLILQWERGTALGCIFVELTSKAVCCLSLLAVDPAQQNGGLGRLLLHEAERFALERGTHTARMTVIRQRKPLIAWYERHGYRRTGEILPFPYEDPSVGTPLRSDLELVVLEKPLLLAKD